MAHQTVFQRYELKYLMTKEQKRGGSAARDGGASYAGPLRTHNDS